MSGSDEPLGCAAEAPALDVAYPGEDVGAKCAKRKDTWSYDLTLEPSDASGAAGIVPIIIASIVELQLLGAWRRYPPPGGRHMDSCALLVSSCARPISPIFGRGSCAC